MRGWNLLASNFICSHVVYVVMIIINRERGIKAEQLNEAGIDKRGV